MKPPNYDRFVLVLDKDDRAALERIAAHEKLSRADIVRRLIRAQHARLLRSNRGQAERRAG